MSNKVYVNCGGELQFFNSKKEVLEFYEDCIPMSEGSEKERYTNIYFSVKEHLNDSKRCFTDGTKHVYISDIEPYVIDEIEEELLVNNFDIDKSDLTRFKADKVLREHSNRIYPSTLKRFKDLDVLYDNFLSNSKDTSFYYFDEDNIICIDTSAGGSDRYWEEDFLLEDYEFADKWLKNEIEYEDYLNIKLKKEDLEL